MQETDPGQMPDDEAPPQSETGDAPEMMTWTVAADDGGTRVEITAEHVPDGISAEDHATGLISSLENLATYVCS